MSPFARQRIEKAVEQVKRILDTTREPCLLEDVMHGYDDKYVLVDACGTNSLRSLWAVLGLLGREAELKSFLMKDPTLSKTMRFQSNQTCRYLREDSYQKELPRHVEVTGDQNVQVKEYIEVKEYRWELKFEYKITVYSGSDSENDVLLLLTGSLCNDKVVTATKTPPAPESSAEGDLEADVSSLSSYLLENLTFATDRTAPSCLTPRRNDDVEKLLQLEQGITELAFGVQGRIGNFLNIGDQANDVVNRVDQLLESLFIPVVTLVDKGKEKDEHSPVFEAAEQQAFFRYFEENLAQLLNSVEEKLYNIIDVKSEESKVLSPTDLKNIALLKVAVLVAHTTVEAIDQVEGLLRSQLVSAIGKICTSSDIYKYMDFHFKRMFKNEFAPRPFSYDVRRQGFSPEGSISIQRGSQELSSCCRVRTQDNEGNIPEMMFSLNASTDVRVQGKQVMHGIMLHRFAERRATTPCKLTASARQFSSFIILLGRIESQNRFQVKHGMVIQNKDKVDIPLNCEALPSAQEFRDAIHSLSPEQQRFAKAYREMQLQATLFGIMVIPVRPLMENIVNLPYGCLTKEIKLTQDLLKLFIEYQIPSDMLTFTGDDTASTEVKTTTVKDHVKSLMDIIEAARSAELKALEEEVAAAVGNKIVDVMEQEDGAVVVAKPMVRKEKKAPRVFRRQAHPPMMMAMASSVAEARPPAPRQEPQAENAYHATESAETPSQDAPTTTTEVGGPGDGLTAIPKLLDQRFEQAEGGRSVKPTTITPTFPWHVSSQKSLITAPVRSTVTERGQKDDLRKTMDLIDALSRSGELPLVDATMHVIVAVTQVFDETVMDTLVKKNKNPIEAIEASGILLNATVQGETKSALLEDGALKRIQALDPKLLEE